MKAVVRRKYGPPNILTVQEISTPEIKPTEILVKVYSTTVNRTDTGILRGKPYLIRLFTGLFKPSSLVPGTDFAGEVVKVGTNVKKYKVGDRVWGLNDEGLASQAEYMKIGSSKAIAKVPEKVLLKK